MKDASQVMIRVIRPEKQEDQIVDACNIWKDVIKDGVLVRAWPDPARWLASPPSLQKSMSLMVSELADYQLIQGDVLAKSVDRSLSVLYKVKRLEILQRLLWSSLRYDELSILIMPSDIPSLIVNDLLRLSDYGSLEDYEACQLDNSWFATFRDVGPDADLMCLVGSRNAKIWGPEFEQQRSRWSSSHESVWTRFKKA